METIVKLNCAENSSFHRVVCASRTLDVINIGFASTF